jgi:uncharacterized phage protein gp47/JayE
MPLNTKTDEQFVSDLVTAWTSIVSAAKGISLSPNLASGDPLLAMLQAQALAGLMFIQSQAVTINMLTRAKTSEGPDLDSWMAQFGFSRLPAAYASGTVQFSVRAVLGTNVTIPVGTIIQTADSTIQYQVVANTENANFNVGLNGYVLQAGQLSVTASVQALVSGSGSNVQAGMLNTFASSVSGINFVTNTAPILDGANPESDASLRSRFILFINSVNARTTPAGTYSACLDVPGVVSVAVLENQDAQGRFLPGYGVIVVDDGSGSPPDSLLNAVRAVIAAPNAPSRGFTITNIVRGPTLATVTIALSVRIDTSSPSVPNSLLNVLNAVLDYVNALEVGNTLFLENISATAKAADPYVIAVGAGSVLINGLAKDLVATPSTIIRTNNVLTTIGQF